METIVKYNHDPNLYISYIDVIYPIENSSVYRGPNPEKEILRFINETPEGKKLVHVNVDRNGCTPVYDTI